MRASDEPVITEDVLIDQLSGFRGNKEQAVSTNENEPMIETPYDKQIASLQSHVEFRLKHYSQDKARAESWRSQGYEKNAWFWEKGRNGI